MVNNKYWILNIHKKPIDRKSYKDIIKAEEDRIGVETFFSFVILYIALSYSNVCILINKKHFSFEIFYSFIKDYWREKNPLIVQLLEIIYNYWKNVLIIQLVHVTEYVASTYMKCIKYFTCTCNVLFSFRKISLL